METKRKDPECLPSSVVSCFRDVVLRVHRSLARSLEYLQLRGKMDFLPQELSAYPLLMFSESQWPPRGQVEPAALAPGPSQMIPQCLCCANARSSEGLSAVVWRHTQQPDCFIRKQQARTGVWGR